MDKPNNTPPPWSEAPPWAKYRAQDKLGLWYWYFARPRAANTCFRSSERFEIASNHNKAIENPNWKTTLQKRPENE